MDDQPGSSSAPRASLPARGRRRVWPWVLAGVPALLLLLLAGVALWTTSSASLRQALSLAQRFLPADQQLEYLDVEGSLAGGGRIARLEWGRPGMTVVIENLELDWSLRQLLGRTLDIRTLSADLLRLRLEPAPPEPPGEPFVMPQPLTLPIELAVPLRLGRVEIESVDATGASSVLVFGQVAADYRYDGTVHALRLDSLQYGESHLQGRASLHARDLELDAAIGAALRDLVPESQFAMWAHAEVSGTLAGGDAAQLAVRVDAREQADDAPPPQASALLDDLAQRVANIAADPAIDQQEPARARVHVDATVHPWRSQPLQALRMELAALDLGQFHASAPHTHIAGDARVEPAAAAQAWRLDLALTNAAPGAWNAQRAPFSTAAIQAGLGDDTLTIDSAQVQLAGSRPAGSVSVQGTVPLQQYDRARLQLRLRELDLRQVHADMPRTGIEGEVSLAPLPVSQTGDTAPGWAVVADVRNTAAGPLDQQRLPVDALLGEIQGTAQLIRAESLRIQAGAGRLQASGQFAPEARTLDVEAELAGLPLRSIHRDLAADDASRLSGRFEVSGDLDDGLAFDADVSGNAATGGAAADAPRAEWEIRAVQASGNWSPSRLTVERIHIDALGAQVEGSRIDVVLPALDSIEARVTASAPGITLDADAAMRQRAGGGRLAVDLGSATQTMAWLRDLPLIGEHVPAMQAEGAARLQAEWQGGWQQWRDGLARPGQQSALQMDASLTSQDLSLELPGAGDGVPTRIDVQGFTASVQGNLAGARLLVDGDLAINDTAATLDVDIGAQRAGGTASSPRWQIDFNRLQASAQLPEQDAPWALRLSEGLQVTLRTGSRLELESTAGELLLTPPVLADARDQPLEVDWEPLSFSRTANGTLRLQSSGRIAGIQPGWLDAFRNEYDAGLLENAGVRTNLLMSGEWDVRIAEDLAVDVHLLRDSGDVWLLGPELRAQPDPLQAAPDDALAAGIRTLDVRVQSEGEGIAATLDWQATRAGEISARVASRLESGGGGWRLPDGAPLDGHLRAQLQDLGMWGILAPPGWRVQGRLEADIRVAGTVQEPQLRGGITGDALNVRSVLDGVELHDGSLRAQLDGQRLRIEELAFQGGTGSKAYISGLSGNRTPPPGARGRMTASGFIDWSAASAAPSGQSGIVLDLSAELQRMQVLVRNDRQLSVSGDLSAALGETGLRVRGDLRVDRATILLPEAGAPTIGDDMIVVRNDDPLDEITFDPGADGNVETALPMDVEIELDLGRDLALSGMGITTRLEGNLTVQSSGNPGQPFAVFGEVRTVEGRYRAWGQALNVETGIVAFNGSYENPALNLLAIRPEIEVRAGVRVTGTLRAPRVELFSDPPLPEAEKLSWVVLGRASAIGGAEGTSMQRAALGLLAGTAVSGLADDLGVDELGLEESALSIGKRVSDELYVTYEAGLSGAASTLYIFYDITRRFTIRGETGEATAVDLIYTIEFD